MTQSRLFNGEELMPCADCVYQGVDSVCRVCRALPCNRRGAWLDKHSPEGRDFIRLREQRRNEAMNHLRAQEDTK